MNRVYMDSTTAMPVRPEVLEVMLPYFTVHYGNPSSIHEDGKMPRMAMDDARGHVAGLIGASPEEVVFTSGATESINLALKGALYAGREGRKGIVITAVDHRAVTATAASMERKGYFLRELAVDHYGKARLDSAMDLLTKDISILSVPFASGEVGTHQPLKELASLAHDVGALVHVDLTMSALMEPFDVRSFDIDLATLSSADLMGPRGVGALYVRKGVRIEHLLSGGGHERGLRSGSENVPGIVGMGEASRIARERMGTDPPMVLSLRDGLISGLTQIEDSYLNGHPTDRLPQNANIRFQYIEGESMLLLLDLNGISVASGSACAQKNLEPSKTLISMGLKHEEAHGSLQFSLSPYTTKADTGRVLDVMPGIVEELRKLSPLTGR
ncbi:MAG: aminotransferase class V-fold PLP-dependent enzyme [Candidatus Thermoplasmatota archaeon]|jgi:cysteine desulfurase|nr:aminotransferase class V-fold PLP-dependent enzyme [Candidatus Thermoplasmatota archaeon]